jgi:hypothetical protein
VSKFSSQSGSSILDCDSSLTVRLKLNALGDAKIAVPFPSESLDDTAKP